MRRPIPQSLAASLVALVLLVTGCTDRSPQPDPSPTGGSPEQTAAQLAAGLAEKDVAGVEFVGASGDQVNTAFAALTSGMGPLSPQVTVGSVTRDGRSATAALTLTWTFPGVPQKWSYETQVALAVDADRWKVAWQPSVVHPQLDGSNRLSQRRLLPKRGILRGDGGRAIMRSRLVYRIGIDKAAITPKQQRAAARRLARLVDVDATAYAKKVVAAGTQAFVEAIVLRADADDLPLASAIRKIPGGTSIQDQRVLAPNRDFARPVIGTVGDATQEIVDKSAGTLVGGDQVGLSGLQARYDAQLRGTPGAQVRLVVGRPVADPADPSASPSPSPAPDPVDPVTVFETKPVAGEELQTTLQPTLQRLAEKTLVKTNSAATMVVIRPSTGAVLVAANNADTKGQSLATVGRAAPGSTFKVVTALALLRAGLTPDSAVNCPTSLVVDGKKFVNYSDYPSDRQGRIDLATALAQSCNTAFIGQRGTIDHDALVGAAASLGFGIDYEAGYSSFFGLVPDDSSKTGRAAALIGQGKVEASALSMAAVVASVSAGNTVIPHLVNNEKPKSTAEPLTAPEARQLRSMMRGVVTKGSGRVLRDLTGGPVLAKTGTAEYGKAPYKTHAWMIAAQDDLAVAVFVNDGQSGSRTAGPLIRTFLAGAY